MTSYWKQALFFFKAVKALGCESRHILFTVICTLYLLPNEHGPYAQAATVGASDKINLVFSHDLIISSLWKTLSTSKGTFSQTLYILNLVHISLETVLVSILTQIQYSNVQHGSQTTTVKLIQSELWKDLKSLSWNGGLVPDDCDYIHQNTPFSLSPFLQPAS